MSSLQLTRRRLDLWVVCDEQGAVANIYLDPWDQVDEVVLFARSSDEVQLQVLRLAASHVQQFVMHRTTYAFGGIMSVEHGDPSLSRGDSVRFMSFDVIPSNIQEMGREEIVEALRELQVGVVVAVHNSVDAAIQAAIDATGVAGLRYRVALPHILTNRLNVEFVVSRPNRFIFWMSNSKPSGSNHELRIVPGYHPVMNGWESESMVNGDTDALIRGGAVRSISCPPASLGNRREPKFMGSWRHVKHPYYAAGRRVFMQVVSTKVRSKEGCAELTRLLRDSLGLDNRYVSISGGFQAPLEYPHNRLLGTRQSSPWPGATRPGEVYLARGSENHCVWAYRVLQAEGELEKAYIPEWFIAEGWLNIYEGAEVRHGIF